MPAMKISSRKGDPCVPERGHRACQHRDSGMRGEKLDRVMPTVGHGKSGNDGNSRNDRNSGNDRDGANRTAGAVRSGCLCGKRSRNWRKIRRKSDPYVVKIHLCHRDALNRARIPPVPTFFLHGGKQAAEYRTAPGIHAKNRRRLRTRPPLPVHRLADRWYGAADRRRSDAAGADTPKDWIRSGL